MSEKDPFWWRLRHSIGTRIIVPFLLLTLLVAGIGTFVITSLVTRSVSDRYTTQLLDAGRVVAEGMISFENDRLETLRILAATTGVGENLVAGNLASLNDLVLPIIINNQVDAVELINVAGEEVYGWQRLPGLSPADIPPRSGNSFAHLEEVELVLNGYRDEFGDKRVLLVNTAEGPILFTIGPVFRGEELVGAIMVGSYLGPMVQRLSQTAVARVTYYDQTGQVIDTTLGSADEETPLSLAANPDRLTLVREALQESTQRYQLVAGQAESAVPFDEIEVLGQQYRLAYGDWRLRGQSFGLFSVAFPTNFISSPLVLGRNVSILIFTLAFVGVLVIGFWVTRRITAPLSQLVDTATAVGDGRLDQRTGIDRPDEIGQLASSFDLMATRLESRNQALLQQTSELETILNSITDGVLLLDTGNQIVTANLAAQKLLADLSHDFFTAGPLREITLPKDETTQSITPRPVVATAVSPQLKRYQIGNRVLTSLTTEVLNPDGQPYGSVIVMRDITQEIEGENLKDAFITSISHELRTPLTVIKAYAELFLKTGNTQLNERQRMFIQNIQKGSQQLEQHINQLIRISEIQAGTIKLDKQTLPFQKLVQNAVDNWQARFASKGIELRARLSGQDVGVSVDPTHMGWAIESLLSNAHNYTETGGTVEVRVSNDGAFVHLAVQDTGIGIATADQPHLFNRFFRAQNSINYEMRGVGLGLFISRAVVEMHHGHIGVKSELGQGSTFTIALPVAEP